MVVGDVVVGDVVDGSIFSTWSGDSIIFWLIVSGLGLIMCFFLCNNESGEISCYLWGSCFSPSPRQLRHFNQLLFSGPEGVFD